MFLVTSLLNEEMKIPETPLVLRRPHMSDENQWINLRRESSDFLRPWEPKWPADDLTRVGFQRRLRVYAKNRKSGWGKTYFLHDTSQSTLVGGLSLTRMTQENPHSATLGYWMGKPFAGKGFMQPTVKHMVNHAFYSQGLSRIEAASLPSNERSIHVLKKCGFRHEGLARDYLEIDGNLEDHLLFGILKSDLTTQLS